MRAHIACGVSLLFILVNAQSERAWEDVQYDWLSPAAWTWIVYGYKSSFPHTFTQTYPGSLYLQDSGGVNGPIFTNMSFGLSGPKAFFVEWVANNASNTVFEILSAELMAEGQFSADNCWPYCGEIDVYEMLRADSASSRAYGATSNYGSLTLHDGNKTKTCFCPSLGGSETWYQNTKPMTSSCSADFQNFPGQQNSIVTIIDSDALGQYIQLIQFPDIVTNSSGTYLLIGADSVATQKIYNNASTFYGLDPATCQFGGANTATGWPYFPQAMHFIMWEQHYGDSGTPTGGGFQVTSFRVFLPSGTPNSDQSFAPYQTVPNPPSPPIPPVAPVSPTVGSTPGNGNPSGTPGSAGSPASSSPTPGSSNNAPPGGTGNGNPNSGSSPNGSLQPPHSSAAFVSASWIAVAAAAALALAVR